MKTIAVSLLKGGVGKTFLATHLAWYLAEAAGRRVVFVDLDPQGSSSRRLARERPGGFAADLFDPSAALAADGQIGCQAAGRLLEFKIVHSTHSLPSARPALIGARLSR